MSKTIKPELMLEYKTEFATYFRSIDGKSIPIGTPVKLEKNYKIRQVRIGEIPFGVVTDRANFIDNESKNNYEKSPRKQFVITDSKSRIISYPHKIIIGNNRVKNNYISDYEWNMVGLLGIINIIKGLPLNNKWQKIDTSSSEDNYYFIF